MPQLEGPEKTLDWGERSRHQLMTPAHTALVAEGSWDEADWAELEEKARSVTRDRWWLGSVRENGSRLSMSSEGVLLAARPMFTSSGGTAENDLARVHPRAGAINAWEVVRR